MREGEFSLRPGGMCGMISRWGDTMSEISHIDSNFKVDTQLCETDIRFYDVKQEPFQLHGVFYASGQFRRIPQEVAKSVSEGVYSLHSHTAGGRVRFRTDSPYIAIHATMPQVGKMSHFALTGSAGFDLYIRDGSEKYWKSFVPPFDILDGYESIVYFDSAQMRDVTIHFPLYSDVSELYIGLRSDALVGQAQRYRVEKPIVYYGSSITQGGCASRPGNSYESMISRRLDADYINLGFSGNAKGEPAIAQYIAGIDMAAFVYDYDYNAPTVEHLENTHRKMYDIIRKAYPALPIILLSRPAFRLSAEEQRRLDVIRRTYEAAKAAGDDHVFLIDGSALMALAQCEGTVDGCHPNDLGFASMAKAVGDVLEQVL